jgi:hypothetical protein
MALGSASAPVWSVSVVVSCQLHRDGIEVRVRGGAGEALRQAHRDPPLPLRPHGLGEAELALGEVEAAGEALADADRYMGK